MDFYIKKKGENMAKGKDKSGEFEITKDWILKTVAIDETLELWEYNDNGKIISPLNITAVNEEPFSLIMTQSNNQWQLIPTSRQGTAIHTEGNFNDQVWGEPTVNVEIGDVRPDNEDKDKNKKK